MQHIKQTIKLLEKSHHYYTIAIGMDSLYSYVSPNYDRNFSLLTDTLLGQPFQVTLHCDDVQICSEAGNKCFEQPDQLHTAILRKHDGKGDYVSTQWELKALFDEHNNPVGIFGIGHNISEYIDARNQLENAETEIEHKNDRLNQIGFLQSHVIRKPLANILGLMQVLDNMEVEPELDQIKTMIIESSTELDNVIKDITEQTQE